MARYAVLRPIMHSGAVYQPGSTIELSDAEAATMTNSQIAEIKAQAADAKPAGKAKAAAVPIPEEADEAESESADGSEDVLTKAKRLQKK
jgi:hypothetical protein